MAGFQISSIQLHRVNVPLNKPFKTHLQTVSYRESIIVEMKDSDGLTGLGECVAFSSPWYTEETVQSCWDAMVDWLIPAINGQEITHPEELQQYFGQLKGNNMAKAALDQATWDLFAKTEKRPLWKVIDGVRDKIDAGVVVTWSSEEELERKTADASKRGYKRIKIKIDATSNATFIASIIKKFPEILFFADANGAFSNEGLNKLQLFDQIGLTLIEQPFKEDEWTQHVEASKLLSTPISLDESLRNYQDVENMIDRKAGSIVTLKPGRVGGLTESLRIHEFCKTNNIPIWLGGMIEFGVSKAHNLALATLPAVTLPGDFSESNHFWDEDLIQPPIIHKDGMIELSELAGIGYELNHEVLKKYCIEKYNSLKA